MGAGVIDPGAPTEGLADRLVGAPLPPSRRSWTPDDVILFHLGVGAGLGGVDRDRRYLAESDLVVLPSFAATVAHATGARLDSLEGVRIDRRQLLHGEQEIVLNGSIPLRADSETTGQVVGVRSLGRSALITVETSTRAEDRALFTTRFGIIVRDPAGFVPRRSEQTTQDGPTRDADLRLQVSTSSRQAAIYRLCGDKNPLHIDPGEARGRGFERPILHGLSTYGAALRAVVDGVLEGDPRRVERFFARFRGHVYPGETLDVRVWRDADGLALRADVLERGAVALSHGRLVLTGG